MDNSIENSAERLREAGESGLSQLARDLGAWVDRLTGGEEGSWLSESFGFGVTPGRILAALVLMALVTGLAVALLSFIRSRAGTLRSMNGFGWIAMVFSAARKPLVFLLLVYGTYFAFGLLIGDMREVSRREMLSSHATTLTYVGLVLASLWLLFRLVRGGQNKLEKWTARSGSRVDNILIPVVGLALRLIIPFVGFIVLVQTLNLSAHLEWVSGKALGVFLIGGIAAVLLRTTRVVEKALLDEHRIDVADNLDARKLYTKVSVIRKITNIVILVVATASILMMFEPVRQLGTSILASAGIAGIVLGLAAQKTLGNLIAGIQIAISQPIRIDDVVIVEGEWGRVEELTLTYVVVRIWDLRRLVLPITYFIEKPFQNWTRTSADLLGTVFLHVDYTIPVSGIREEFRRILEGHPLWDGKVCVVQVTDAGPQTIELRLLLSTADASKGWDLRCEVRERMVAFIQEHYPDALPRVRAEVHRNGGGGGHLPEPGSDQTGTAQPGIDASTDELR